jgi:hypothetical protein
MKRNSGSDVAHALVFTENEKPLRISAAWVHWTENGYSAFRAILNSARQNFSDAEKTELSIPTGSLRSLLELRVDDLLATAPQLRLANRDLNSASYKREPFAIFKHSDSTDQLITEVMNDWFDSRLFSFIERHSVPDQLREDIANLLDDSKLFEIRNEKFNLFPWERSDNSTAIPCHEMGYPFAANDIAILLEGKKVFPELPPLARIVGSDIRRNSAELMTPVIRNFEEGDFSLVCSISIETLPGVSTPLICIDFKRRRWVKSLDSKYTHVKSSKGYVLKPGECRAYTFQVEKKKDKHSEWNWRPTDGWDVLSERFDLPSAHDANDILSLRSLSEYDVVVAHKYGIEKEGSHLSNRVGSGVSEVDRVDAFNNILSTLSPFGFSAFCEFERIENPSMTLKGLAYLDVQTFSSIGSDEDVSHQQDDENISLQESVAIFEHEVDHALNQIASEWEEVLKNIEENSVSLPGRLERVQKMLELNRDLIRQCLPSQNNETPVLTLLCQDQSDVWLLKKIAFHLFGDAIEIRCALLPQNTHGPEEDLPANKQSIQNRMDARLRIWETFSQNHFSDSRRHVCLVQAQEWYVKANGKPKHDDLINKSAAKVGLASGSSVPVQYLLPLNRRIRDKEKQLSDYIHRAQSALLDLMFGHAGVVPGIADLVSKYFEDIKKKPNYIYGIAVVKANKTDLRSRSSELLVATRVNVNSGIPEVKLGYSTNMNQIWLPFEGAMRFIARRYNSSFVIGSDSRMRSENFQKFCRGIFEEANGENGCIFIESTHAARLWPWLSDGAVDVSNINFSSGSKADFGSLCIIRVREQSPPLMVEKYNEQFGVHTTCARLFRVNKGNIPIYWSLGNPFVRAKRGLSVYRSIKLPNSAGDIKEFGPLLKPAPTPNAVEFTVLSKPNDGDNDLLAAFSASLRRGALQAKYDNWLRVPAPLYIIRKVEEFLTL